MLSLFVQSSDESFHSRALSACNLLGRFVSDTERVENTIRSAISIDEGETRGIIRCCVGY